MLQKTTFAAGVIIALLAGLVFGALYPNMIVDRIPEFVPIEKTQLGELYPLDHPTAMFRVETPVGTKFFEEFVPRGNAGWRCITGVGCYEAGTEEVLTR